MSQQQQDQTNEEDPGKITAPVVLRFPNPEKLDPTIFDMKYVEAAGLPFLRDAESELAQYHAWFQEAVPQHFINAGLERIVTTLKRMLIAEMNKHISALKQIELEYETRMQPKSKLAWLPPEFVRRWVIMYHEWLVVHPRATRPRIDNVYAAANDEVDDNEDAASNGIHTVVGSEAYQIAETKASQDTMYNITTYLQITDESKEFVEACAQEYHTATGKNLAVPAPPEFDEEKMQDMSDFERRQWIESQVSAWTQAKHQIETRRYKIAARVILAYVRNVTLLRQKAHDTRINVDFLHTALRNLRDHVNQDRSQNPGVNKHVLAWLGKVYSKMPEGLSDTFEDGGYHAYLEANRVFIETNNQVISSQASETQEHIAYLRSVAERPLSFDELCTRVVRSILPDASNAQCTAVRQCLAILCLLRFDPSQQSQFEFRHETLDVLLQTLEHVPRAIEPAHVIPVAADTILDAACGLSIAAKYRALHKACGGDGIRTSKLTLDKLHSVYAGKTGNMSARTFLGHGYLDAMTRRRIWNQLSVVQKLRVLAPARMPSEIAPMLTLGLCTRRDSPLSNLRIPHGIHFMQYSHSGVVENRNLTWPMYEPPEELKVQPKAKAKAVQQTSASASAAATKPDEIIQATSAASNNATEQLRPASSVDAATARENAEDIKTVLDLDAGRPQRNRKPIMILDDTASSVTSHAIEAFWNNMFDVDQDEAKLEQLLEADRAWQQGTADIARYDVLEDEDQDDTNINHAAEDRQNEIGDTHVIMNYSLEWPAVVSLSQGPAKLIEAGFRALVQQSMPETKAGQAEAEADDEDAGQAVVYEKDDFQVVHTQTDADIEDHGVASAATTTQHTFERVFNTSLETQFSSLGPGISLCVNDNDTFPLFDVNETNNPLPQRGISRVGMIFSPLNGAFDDLRESYATELAEIYTEERKAMRDDAARARDTRVSSIQTLMRATATTMIRRLLMQLQMCIAGNFGLLDRIKVMQFIENTRERRRRMTIKLTRIQRALRRVNTNLDQPRVQENMQFVRRVIRVVQVCMAFYDNDAESSLAGKHAALNLADRAWGLVRQGLVKDEITNAYTDAQRPLPNDALTTLAAEAKALATTDHKMTAQQLPPLRTTPSVVFAVMTSLYNAAPDHDAVEGTYAYLESIVARLFADMLTVQGPPEPEATAAAATTESKNTERIRANWSRVIEPLRLHLCRRFVDASGTTRDGLNGAVIALPWLPGVSGNQMIAGHRSEYKNVAFLGCYPRVLEARPALSRAVNIASACTTPFVRDAIRRWFLSFAGQTRVMPRMISTQSNLLFSSIPTAPPAHLPSTINALDLAPRFCYDFLSSLTSHANLAAVFPSEQELDLCDATTTTWPPLARVKASIEVTEHEAYMELQEADNDITNYYYDTGTDSDVSDDEDREDLGDVHELGHKKNRHIVGERIARINRTAFEHLWVSQPQIRALVAKDQDTATRFKTTQIDMKVVTRNLPYLAQLVEDRPRCLDVLAARDFVVCGRLAQLHGTSDEELIRVMPPATVEHAMYRMDEYVRMRSDPILQTEGAEKSPFYKAFANARRRVEQAAPTVAQMIGDDLKAAASRVEQAVASEATETKAPRPRKRVPASFRDMVREQNLWLDFASAEVINAILEMSDQLSNLRTLFRVLEHVHVLTRTANGSRTDELLDREKIERIRTMYTGGRITDDQSPLLAYLTAEMASIREPYSNTLSTAALQARTRLVELASSYDDARFLVNAERILRPPSQGRRPVRYNVVDSDDEYVPELDAINEVSDEEYEDTASDSSDDDDGDLFE